MTRSQSGVVGAPQVVHDLHHLAGVDAGEVGQELEPERRLVVERGDHLGHVAGRDADLGLVVALADGAGQLRRRSGASRRALNARSTLRPRSGTVGPIARSGQWPRRSLTSCWSFIIP